MTLVTTVEIILQLGSLIIWEGVQPSHIKECESRHAMGQAAVQLSIAGNAMSVWSESVEKTGSAQCSAPWGELWSSGALFPPPGQSRFLNDKSRHTSAQDAA